ncbi:hypothetical protein MY8738_004078 [Beauveria namnaoensis]
MFGILESVATPRAGVYSSYEDLIENLNERMEKEGYKIVKSRSHRAYVGGADVPNNGIIRCDLVCNRGGRAYKSEATQRKTTTKKTGCPWKAKAVHRKTLGGWVLTVACDQHNHEPGTPEPPSPEPSNGEDEDVEDSSPELPALGPDTSAAISVAGVSETAVRLTGDTFNQYKRDYRKLSPTDRMQLLSNMQMRIAAIYAIQNEDAQRQRRLEIQERRHREIDTAQGRPQQSRTSNTYKRQRLSVVEDLEYDQMVRQSAKLPGGQRRSAAEDPNYGQMLMQSERRQLREQHSQAASEPQMQDTATQTSVSIPNIGLAQFPQFANSFRRGREANPSNAVAPPNLDDFFDPLGSGTSTLRDKMSTVLPPPSKRQRREQLERSRVQQDVTAVPGPEGSFKARFVDPDGNQQALVEVPLADASEKNLSLLLNTLLAREKEDFVPYRFRIHIPDSDIIVDQYPNDLLQLLRSHGIENPFETTVTLSAEPQAVFKVKAVTRMSHRIPAHGEAILAAQFPPQTSSLLATGSGDNTARIMDTDTGTPKYTLSGHKGWVLCVAWSPDGRRLATGSMDKTVRLWDPVTGKAVSGGTFSGHAKWVTNMAWEPYHLWRDGTPRLASASKDSTVRVWMVDNGTTEHVLSGHKSSVSCVKWGGTGNIYTASHDKTVKVWNAELGTLLHTLSSHAHWVNHLALSTEFALRTSYFDHTPTPATEQEKRAKAKERFEKAAKIQGKVAERLVSASDDFTMYLWDPSQGTKPVARMLGHQKQVNHVTFSPDGSLIASSGWDNHTKLWNARDGKFINTLRGHVAPVYQCAFSADSRLLVTASKDTTLKVWSMATHKLAADLPGHQDEVYAVDWSPDGKKVGSGGKDKAVRLWCN